MNYYPEFARLLNEYLTKADLSPSWLARRLRVAPSTVTRWLNDGARPGNGEMVIRIADTLGVHSPPERQQLLAAAGYGYSLVVADVERTEDEGAAAVGGIKAWPMPFLAPPLPPQGIFGRETTLQEIATRLAFDQPMATNVPPLALQGMGGIGKTTLAVAVGRSPAVARLFPDGVLWASVGPRPTIRFLLDEWGRALGVDLLAERDADACRERLRTLLHQRRVLLLIDDLWEIKHGDYFTLAGPYGRTIFTTREAPVAHTLATRERTMRVDLLPPSAAFALLRRLAPEAVAADKSNAQRLCERLEFLPLALTLAGRLLANEADVPTRMQRLLDELIERRQARLQLLQVEGRWGLDEENPVSLQAILGMSVERLSKTDQERFAMLAVFAAEPLTWEMPAAAHVWECPLTEAEATLATLIQRGLVMPPAVRGHYRIHALLADYAAMLLEEWQL